MVIGINGPIASGKSTVGRGVGERLRLRGATAAVIDIDLLYGMLDGAVGVPKADERSWTLARRGAAVLADRFLSAGTDVVVVEGRLFASERAVLLAALPAPVPCRFVTLHVSYGEALRRARTDPSRGVSRDPAFLRPYFDDVAADLAAVPASDLVIDTERLGVDAVVAAIVGLVDERP